METVVNGTSIQPTQSPEGPVMPKWVATIFGPVLQLWPILAAVVGMFWNASIKINAHDQAIAQIKDDIKDVKTSIASINKSIFDMAISLKNK